MSYSAWKAKTASRNGCLYALVLFMASCVLCPRTGAWERFHGSRLWEGTHALQVTGDSTLDWKDGRAHVYRVSALAGEDAFGISLHGPASIRSSV